MCLHHVARRPQVESFLHNISRRFLTQEDNSGLWGEFADLASGCDTVQVWEPDIEHNQVRFQLTGFLDRLEPIRGFANDLKFRPSSQR